MVELIVAAAMALGAAGSPAPQCSAYETRAIVGGRAVCLSEADACRPRYQQQYGRYGFRCRGGLLSYDWPRLYRPVRVPTLSPGESCPASVPNGTLGQRGNTDAIAAFAFG